MTSGWDVRGNQGDSHIDETQKLWVTNLSRDLTPRALEDWLEHINKPVERTPPVGPQGMIAC